MLPFDEAAQARVLQVTSQWAKAYRIATILGMEQTSPAGRQIAAAVFDTQGALQGIQTKNQLDPSEDPFYVPGNTRQIFEVKHSVLSLASRSATRAGVTQRPCVGRPCAVRIVFTLTSRGSHLSGVRLTTWGAADAPYYEKAMMMRSRENSIYFASVNYALRFQESATSLIAPSGEAAGPSAVWRGGPAGAGDQARAGHRAAGDALRAGALQRKIDVREVMSPDGDIASRISPQA